MASFLTIFSKIKLVYYGLLVAFLWIGFEVKNGSGYSNLGDVANRIRYSYHNGSVDGTWAAAGLHIEDEDDLTANQRKTLDSLQKSFQGYEFVFRVNPANPTLRSFSISYDGHDDVNSLTDGYSVIADRIYVSAADKTSIGIPIFGGISDFRAVYKIVEVTDDKLVIECTNPSGFNDNGTDSSVQLFDKPYARKGVTLEFTRKDDAFPRYTQRAPYTGLPNEGREVANQFDEDRNKSINEATEDFLNFDF